MDASLWLSLALSGIVGFSLGVFGGGGSILAVPMLVYVTGVAPASAVGMSLAIVGATSLTASYAHHRRGQVQLRAAALFGGAGIVTAFVGAKLTGLVSGSALMLVFAALMVLVGGWMFVGTKKIEPIQMKKGRTRPRVVHTLLAGAAVGAVTGFLGVGGGFLVVPALIAFTGLDMRAAVGTSLFVIAINSAAGFVGHLDDGRLDFPLLAMLTAMALIGALVGERTTRHVSVDRLRGSFALFVIVVGVAVAVVTCLGGNKG